jgi:hypothetical protein
MTAIFQEKLLTMTLAIEVQPGKWVVFPDTASSVPMEQRPKPCIFTATMMWYWQRALGNFNLISKETIEIYPWMGLPGDKLP